MRRHLPRLPMQLLRLWISSMSVLISIAAAAQQPFITTWKTDNPGEGIIIPVNPNIAGYNYTVDWGDGVITQHTEEATHTYATSGTHTVSITGDFPALYRPGSKLLSVDQWGDIQWKSMERAFQDASNIVLNATDAPNLSAVSSMAEMFSRASSFNGDLAGWDVSHITDMSK